MTPESRRGTVELPTDGNGHTMAEMTDDEKRHDELTTAPKAVESDAAPRITTSKTASGATRIDIAETASVRPGIDPKDKP